MGLRPIVLHLHLFKNAGSTLDWSLQRFFARAFCDHRDDDAMRGNPAYLTRFLSENAQVRALSSHWLPMPLDMSHTRLMPRVLVMLRHPIERIASVYAFERRQDVDHPGTRRAKARSLQEYVAWRLAPGTGPVLKNYQTRMLSGDYPGPGDEAQFETALENLESVAAVGLVERYDESMVLFEAALREHFPGIDLSYRVQNVRDPADPRSPAERLAAAEHALGELLEPAREANRFDLALYERVTARFARALQQVPEAPQQLARLKDRCSALEAE